jgi:hypothetical protein
MSTQGESWITVLSLTKKGQNSACQKKKTTIRLQKELLTLSPGTFQKGVDEIGDDDDE